MIKKLLAILVVLLVGSFSRVSAQEETYRFDLGAQAGVSGYIGDARRAFLLIRGLWVAFHSAICPM